MPLRKLVTTHVAFCLYVNVVCGISAHHNFEEHVHEAHGHKTATSSKHGEEREEENERTADRKGIFSKMFSLNLLDCIE